MRLELLVSLAPTERPVAGYVLAPMWRGQRVKSIAQQVRVILLAGAVAIVLAGGMDRGLDIVVVGAGVGGLWPSIPDRLPLTGQSGVFAGHEPLFMGTFDTTKADSPWPTHPPALTESSSHDPPFIP